MGCLCCCCSSKEKEDYEAFNDEDYASQNYGTTNEGNTISDGESLLDSGHSASQIKNTSQLITDSTKQKWNINETERLEHELEKEIVIQQYKHTADKTVIIHDVDEILEDSLEQSISEQREFSKSADEPMNDEEQDADRRPSNLFRYQSKKTWDSNDLDEQENSMQRQIDFMVQQNSQKTSND